jgi:hypothetical protein
VLQRTIASGAPSSIAATGAEIGESPVRDSAPHEGAAPARLWRRRDTRTFPF